MVHCYSLFCCLLKWHLKCVTYGLCDVKRTAEDGVDAECIIIPLETTDLIFWY